MIPRDVGDGSTLQVLLHRLKNAAWQGIVVTSSGYRTDWSTLLDWVYLVIFERVGKVVPGFFEPYLQGSDVMTGSKIDWESTPHVHPVASHSMPMSLVNLTF